MVFEHLLVDGYGFFFRTVEEYKNEVVKLRNAYGDPVEEFEIQFIDGDRIDSALFRALCIHHGDIEAYLEKACQWDEWQKINVIIATGEVGYEFDLSKDDPDMFDIQIYEVDTLRDLAEIFIDEGYYGDIPDILQFYIDYDAIARDLAVDYIETNIAGKRLVYCIN